MNASLPSFTEFFFQNDFMGWKKATVFFCSVSGRANEEGGGRDVFGGRRWTTSFRGSRYHIQQLLFTSDAILNASENADAAGDNSTPSGTPFRALLISPTAKKVPINNNHNNNNNSVSTR